MELEPVIGLEIHAHLSTRTKLFCGCSNDSFDAAPNTAVCPVCTAQPGALPVLNAAAVAKAARAALLMQCSIRPLSKFDRKNYFYPDLPSGYQISQYDEPFAERGMVSIRLPSGTEKEIRVNRLHIENDAGKLTHEGTVSHLDFNRAGCPLAEIVSEPDMRSADEAVAYAEAVQRIVQYADASHADMYKGEMRFDASVSVRPRGEEKLYPRVEIKNLNSFRALHAAIQYEISRQSKLFIAGTPVSSACTVGWSDDDKKTFIMRDKEDAADYRYFPEPDIPPLAMPEEIVAGIRAALPEAPHARMERCITQYGLTREEAHTLTETRERADYFEVVAATAGDGKKAAGWVLTELLAKLPPNTPLTAQKVTAEQLGELVRLIVSGEISGKIAKEVFPVMYDTGNDPASIISEKGLKQVSDVGALTQSIEAVLAEHAQSVADYRAGKQQAFGFLVGQVMKKTGGQANPGMVNALLKEKLV